MGGGDRMRGILTQIEDEMHERLIIIPTVTHRPLFGKKRS